MKQKPKRPSGGKSQEQRKKTHAPRRANASRKQATAAPLAESITKTASGAGQLYAKSDLLHRQADALHKSIQAAHATARNLHARLQENVPGISISRQEAAVMTHEAETDGDGETERKYAKPFPIVGIGASAGGFEALTQFLAALPKDTGMAFVVVQHLDPSHESKLTELLGHSATLPIAEIRPKTQIHPDHIYVMPSNVTVTLSKDHLRLVQRRSTEIPPMPIDRFFRSLAAGQQDRAIGVVLSGTGSDGTLGLEAIKGEGGVTFAQDEASSKYFGMPGSAIGAGAVDFILSPVAMARQLGRIARHPYVAPDGDSAKKKDQGRPWDKLLHDNRGELHTIFGLLRSRTNVDFAFYKHSTLRRRIVRRMILHKMETLSNYVRFLEGHPAEVDGLFNDLLINVTEFFRDPRTFETLQKFVFPKLVKSHSSDSPLRIWVCGCSTGEEAYSIAIALVEFFDKHQAHRHVQIFGTDISDVGIEKARAGIYPPNIQQDISPERLRRFFVKVDGHYQVLKTIRDMCIFARQNVIVDPPFSNLDLISCRNVLIYLGPLLQRKIIPLFHYALRPNGYLLLGNSETIGTSTEFFSLVKKKHKLYAKKTTFLRPTFELPDQRQKQQAAERGRGGAEPPATLAEIRLPDLQQHVDKLLLRDFSPGAVVINAQLDVLHFRGRTGNYLEHAPGAASLNLLKMAHDSLAIDLRTIVTRAIKQNSKMVQKGVRLRLNGHIREITIEVHPLQLTPATEPLYLVLFRETPVHEAEPLHKPAPHGGDKSRTDGRALEQLRQELRSTKESLQSIIEEQEATNEELKSANEEIQSSNEELQSTNEELETAKEELQSTNEELTTLNEELQNRNGELTTVNNDLSNLFSSVTVAILMLGDDLTIRRFTPMAEKIFHLIPSDVGRRLSDMNRSIIVPDLDKTIREVVDNLTTIERDVQDREGHWYSLRIRPYRTRENKIEGAVLMLIDIDEVKRAVDSLMLLVKQPVVALTPDLKVKRANESFCKTFGLEPEKIENRPIYEIGNGQLNLQRLQTLLEVVLPDNRQVDNYELEAKVDGTEKKIRVSARRFFEETRGLQMILLAMELL